MTQSNAVSLPQSLTVTPLGGHCTPIKDPPELEAFAPDDVLERVGFS